MPPLTYTEEEGLGAVSSRVTVYGFFVLGGVRIPLGPEASERQEAITFLAPLLDGGAEGTERSSSFSLNHHEL
jgi:hypothetical protein